jgi:isopentenyl-diphosphate Delta-isomerase
MNNEENRPLVEVLTPIFVEIDGISHNVEKMSDSLILCALNVSASRNKILTTTIEKNVKITSEPLGYNALNFRCEIKRISPSSISLRPSESESLSKLNAILSSLRKEQHIEICAKKDVEHSERTTGFSDFSFMPSTFPEANYDDINLSTEFLDHSFSAPIFVTGMTGGVKLGGLLNERIARTCERFNIAMGVGSQRIAIEHPEYSDIFDVKRHAPNLFLMGNIGVAQLAKGMTAKHCIKAVDMIKADALALHVNVLQEVIQVEGDRNFDQLFEKIESVVKALNVPVVIKEVGSGLDAKSAKILEQIGVSAIDIGGAGGTSWGYIEGLRAADSKTKNLAKTFRNWGIPTAYNIRALKSAGLSIPFTATGGIRDGLTVAKSVSLGASMAGLGLPIFKAALQNEEAVTEKIDEIIEGTKIACMLTGSKKLNELSGSIIKGLPFEHL